jgi:hypothetical protein
MKAAAEKPSGPGKGKNEMSAAILSLLLTIAAAVGVDPGLAQSLVLHENPGLVPNLSAGPNGNGTYDLGIAGLNSNYLDYFVERYWDREGVFDWKVPEHNIYVGLRHLKYLLAIPDFNDWQAIMAYNCGERAVRSGAPPASSIEYANAVYVAWRGGE